MTILWFFLVVSWNGELTAYHGFPDEADCHEKQLFMKKQLDKVVRDVTDCIGIPIKGGKK